MYVCTLKCVLEIMNELLNRKSLALWEKKITFSNFCFVHFIADCLKAFLGEEWSLYQCLRVQSRPSCSHLSPNYLVFFLNFLVNNAALKNM